MAGCTFLQCDHLLQWLANLCCRCLLRHIFLQYPQSPTVVYTETMLSGSVSRRECIFSHDQQFEQGWYAHTLGHDDL